MLDILSVVGNVKSVKGFLISTVNHMTEFFSHVRYVNGEAEVQFDSRSFTVAGREALKRKLCCPIELVVGALGS